MCFREMIRIPSDAFSKQTVTTATPMFQPIALKLVWKPLPYLSLHDVIMFWYILAREPPQLWSQDLPSYVLRSASDCLCWWYTDYRFISRCSGVQEYDLLARSPVHFIDDMSICVIMSTFFSPDVCGTFRFGASSTRHMINDLMYFISRVIIKVGMGMHLICIIYSSITAWFFRRVLSTCEILSLHSNWPWRLCIRVPKESLGIRQLSNHSMRGHFLEDLFSCWLRGWQLLYSMQCLCNGCWNFRA